MPLSPKSFEFSRIDDDFEESDDELLSHGDAQTPRTSLKRDLGPSYKLIDPLPNGMDLYSSKMAREHESSHQMKIFCVREIPSDDDDVFSLQEQFRDQHKKIVKKGKRVGGKEGKVYQDSADRLFGTFVGKHKVNLALTDVEINTTLKSISTTADRKIMVLATNEWTDPDYFASLDKKKLTKAKEIWCPYLTEEGDNCYYLIITIERNSQENPTFTQTVFDAKNSVRRDEDANKLIHDDIRELGLLHIIDKLSKTRVNLKSDSLIYPEVSDACDCALFGIYVLSKYAQGASLDEWRITEKNQKMMGKVDPSEVRTLVATAMLEKKRSSTPFCPPPKQAIHHSFDRVRNNDRVRNKKVFSDDEDTPMVSMSSDSDKSSPQSSPASPGRSVRKKTLLAKKPTLSSKIPTAQEKRNVIVSGRRKRSL